MNLVGNNLTLGQRVYLSGNLQSTTYVNIENEYRQQYQVLVSEIYASEPNENGANSDEESNRCVDFNSVFVLAHIASDIQHMDNFSRFYVATHHSSK